MIECDRQCRRLDREDDNVRTLVLKLTRHQFHRARRIRATGPGDLLSRPTLRPARRLWDPVSHRLPACRGTHDKSRSLIGVPRLLSVFFSTSMHAPSPFATVPSQTPSNSYDWRADYVPAFDLKKSKISAAVSLWILSHSTAPAILLQRKFRLRGVSLYINDSQVPVSSVEWQSESYSTQVSFTACKGIV